MFTFILIFGLIFLFVSLFLEVLPFLIGFLVLMGVGYAVVCRMETGGAVEAVVLSEEPIVKNKAVQTGFTDSYNGRFSSHEHYEYRDVVEGYRVRFFVRYENGAKKTVLCNKGDRIYRRLIRKVSSRK